jgi:hypothetical protein
LDGNCTRELCGALVYFNELGHVSKVSLPNDFSIVCITGFTSVTTSRVVCDLLESLGFAISVDSVRIQARSTPSDTKAIVRVENPLFAKELDVKLKSISSPLHATPTSGNMQRVDYRKVYISWHKSTRNAFLEFGKHEIADSVAAKFNTNVYTCLGLPVKASAITMTSGRNRAVYLRSGPSQKSLAWTLCLSGLPSKATARDVNAAFARPSDRPQHVELTPASHTASEAEVSVHVRSRLGEHGALESFRLAPESKGKRVKATAWFQDESDAQLACSLNNKRLDILGGGKLTVTRIKSFKIKVSTAIYLALKSRIDQQSCMWKEQHLVFNIYPDPSRRFVTLKLEGEVAKDVATARKTLDNVLDGEVLSNGQNDVWDSALCSNGVAYRRLKAAQEALGVIIVRDKTKRQLRYYGPAKMYQQCTCGVIDMLKETSIVSQDIHLNPVQFSRLVRGGYKRIEESLEKHVTVFDVVSKKITISGTQEHYNVALAITNGDDVTGAPSLAESQMLPVGDCPICFCEAENAIQTSCKHTYCQECFEECCKTAASTSTKDFQVKCQGDGGTCAMVFSLLEMKELLPTAAFDLMLKSSFEEYVHRNPQDIRYCPTPDCGHAYRSTATKGLDPPPYTCANCLEPLCTSCNARHGEYTCAEYKDIASGGYEALAKLKKELNIKDCPKCSTPLEKTEGCNHMTCAGCKAHICWVCMAVFDTSGPCYAHMTKEHGGNGLGLEAFQ